MTPRLESFRTVVTAMCVNPEHLGIREVVTSRAVTLTIEPRPQDFGCILGKRGVNLRSLRVLFAIAVAREHGIKGDILLVTPDARTSSVKPFVPDRTFNGERLRQIVEPMCAIVFKEPVVSITDIAATASRVTVSVPSDEPLGYDDADVADALLAVVNTIGKANGRNIIFEFVRRPSQATAAARSRWQGK